MRIINPTLDIKVNYALMRLQSHKQATNNNNLTCYYIPKSVNMRPTVLHKARQTHTDIERGQTDKEIDW